MYKAVGVKTLQVYATGSKADCMRALQKKFESHDYGIRATNETILPEPIILMKVTED